MIHPNRKQLLSVLVVLVAVAAAGFGRGPAPRTAHAPIQTQGRASAAASPGVPTQQVPAARLPVSPADPMTGVAGPALLEDLVARVANDAGFRQSLEQRYLASADSGARRNLLALLAAAPVYELVAFAGRLLAHIDPSVRRDAYLLLARAPSTDASVQRLWQRALLEEQDAQALPALLRGFAWEGGVTAEQARVAARLLDCAAHEDPRVRVEALPQLARRLDPGHLEAPLRDALLDAEANVRAAGIEGLVAAGIESPRLRELLLDLASNETEGHGLRVAALQALTRVALSPAQMERQQQLIEALALHPDNDTGIEVESPAS